MTNGNKKQETTIFTTEETNSLRNCLKVVFLLYASWVCGALAFAGFIGIIVNAVK
jgi:uncharacterized membrane protein